MSSTIIQKQFLSSLQISDSNHKQLQKRLQLHQSNSFAIGALLFCCNSMYMLETYITKQILFIMSQNEEIQLEYRNYMIQLQSIIICIVSFLSGKLTQFLSSVLILILGELITAIGLILFGVFSLKLSLPVLIVAKVLIYIGEGLYLPQQYIIQKQFCKQKLQNSIFLNQLLSYILYAVLQIICQYLNEIYYVETMILGSVLIIFIILQGSLLTFKKEDMMTKTNWLEIFILEVSLCLFLYGVSDIGYHKQYTLDICLIVAGIIIFIVLQICNKCNSNKNLMLSKQLINKYTIIGLSIILLQEMLFNFTIIDLDKNQENQNVLVYIFYIIYSLIQYACKIVGTLLGFGINIKVPAKIQLIAIHFLWFIVLLLSIIQEIMIVNDTLEQISYYLSYIFQSYSQLVLLTWIYDLIPQEQSQNLSICVINMQLIGSQIIKSVTLRLDQYIFDIQQRQQEEENTNDEQIQQIYIIYDIIVTVLSLIPFIESFFIKYFTFEKSKACIKSKNLIDEQQVFEKQQRPITEVIQVADDGGNTIV